MDVTSGQLLLFSRIYNVVLDSKNWPDILVQLAHSTDAKYANLLFSDLKFRQVPNHDRRRRS